MELGATLLKSRFHFLAMEYLPFQSHTRIYGLSQQGVWVSFWTPKPLKSTPQDIQIYLRGVSLNANFKHMIEFFHLHIIPMILYKDIMPYFDKFLHVYGCNLNTCILCVP